MTAPVISAVLFGVSAGYAAWFWRAPRSPVHWGMFCTLTLATFVAWWWLLRRSGFNVTTATVLYDVIVIVVWYAPLIIWREKSVTLAQTLGLLLVVTGSIVVAVAGE